MKRKKTLCIILVLLFGLTMTGCSKKGSGTTANAQSNNQGGGENIAQTNYYGEMDEDEIMAEMGRLHAKQMAGLKQEEFLEWGQRIEELGAKLEEASNSKTSGVASAPSSGSPAGSSNGKSSGEKVVEKKYQGEFITKTFNTVDRHGRETTANVFLYLKPNETSFVTGYSYGGSEEPNYQSLWTEGNSLMAEGILWKNEKTGDLDLLHGVKLGTFTDNDTFVYDADDNIIFPPLVEFWGSMIKTENVVFKRRK